MFSFAPNSTACPNATYADACVYGPHPYYGPNLFNLTYTGDEVASNYSSSIQVVTLPSTVGPIAVMTAPSSGIPLYSTFKTRTFGVAASCVDVLDYNTYFSELNGEFQLAFDIPGTLSTAKYNSSQLTNGTTTFTFYATQDVRVTSDGDAVTYGLEEASNTVSAPFDGAGHGVTNPFGFSSGLVFYIKTLQDSGATDFSMNFFCTTCKVYFYDVGLSYGNGSYTIESQQLANEKTTTWLFLPFVDMYLYQWLLPKITYNLYHNINDANLSVPFATQLSQLGMAYSAPIVQRTPTEVNAVTPFVGSRYPISALAFLWSSAALYAVVALALILSAVFLTGEVVLVRKPDEESSEGESTSTLHLAHQRLVNPVAIVAENFELSDNYDRHPKAKYSLDEVALSVQEDVFEMFPDSRADTQTRLRVGFLDGNTGGIKDGSVNNPEARQATPFRIAY